MMSLEQIKEGQKKLAMMEQKHLNLRKLDEVQAMLDNGQFLLDLTKVEGSFTGASVRLSMILTDREQVVMGKSIQIAVEFARQRLIKELEEMSE